MIRKRNQVIHGILALFFLAVVCLVGCQRIQQVVAPTDSEAPDSTGTVKIGFLYSPPDPGTTRNGAELAVALANEAGGINGLPIELLIRDDKKDLTLSVQSTKELINAGVSAIVGPDYSILAIPVGDVVQEHGIPMVTTYPTNPKVPENRKFSFMGAFTDPYQAGVMAGFAVQELGATTAAVLTEAGETYSQRLTEVFVEEFTDQGGTIAGPSILRDRHHGFHRAIDSNRSRRPRSRCRLSTRFGSRIPVSREAGENYRYQYPSHLPRGRWLGSTGSR